MKLSIQQERVLSEIRAEFATKSAAEQARWGRQLKRISLDGYPAATVHALAKRELIDVVAYAETVSVKTKRGYSRVPSVTLSGSPH